MTRDEILDASAQIFSLKGYHGTSMQDIAAAVNLQKASVYHHVSSKQQILFELLNRGLQILSGKVEDAIAKPGPPEIQLRSNSILFTRVNRESRIDCSASAGIPIIGT